MINGAIRVMNEVTSDLKEHEAQIRQWFDSYFRTLYLPKIEKLRFLCPTSPEPSETKTARHQLNVITQGCAADYQEWAETYRMLINGRYNEFIRCFNNDSKIEDVWVKYKNDNNRSLSFIEGQYENLLGNLGDLSKAGHRHGVKSVRDQHLVDYLVSSWLKKTGSDWLRSNDVLPKYSNKSIREHQAVFTKALQQRQQRKLQVQPLAVWLSIPDPWSKKLPDSQTNRGGYEYALRVQKVLVKALQQWLRYWSDFLGYGLDKTVQDVNPDRGVKIHIILSFDSHQYVQQWQSKKDSKLSALSFSSTSDFTLKKLTGLIPSKWRDHSKEQENLTIEYQKIAFTEFEGWLRSFLFCSPRENPWGDVSSCHSVLSPEYVCQDWGLSATELNRRLFLGARYEELAKQLYKPDLNDYAFRVRVIKRLCDDRLVFL